jgi:hypothetical protein
LIHEWRFPELMPEMRGMYYGEPTGEYFRDNGETTFSAPRYTASIDAAMALFPEGYFPVLDADPRHIEVEVQYLTDETDNGLGACVATGGKTIALALCAASLRARADGAGE